MITDPSSRSESRSLLAHPPHGVSGFVPALVIAAVLSVSGCGEDDLPPGLAKKAVRIEEVPEALVAAARKEIPRAKLDEAWQNLDPQGKLHSYEIRGRQASDGKIREVRVSPEGKILESE